MRGLIRPHPDDPARGAGQCTIERLDLADVAAGLADLHRFIKAVDAVFLDQRFELLVARIDGADAPAVAPLGLRPQLISFGKQAAGIEGDDIDVETALADHLQDGLILETEARRENKLAGHFAAESRQAFGRRQIGEHRIEVGGLRGQAFAIGAGDYAPLGLRIDSFRIVVDSENQAAPGNSAAKIEHQPSGPRIDRVKIGGDRLRQGYLDFADVIARDGLDCGRHQRARIDGVVDRNNGAAAFGHADANADRRADRERLFMQPEHPGPDAVRELGRRRDCRDNVAALDKNLPVECDADRFAGACRLRQLPIVRLGPGFD
jgi:hypothetical protein